VCQHRSLLRQHDCAAYEKKNVNKKWKEINLKINLTSKKLLN
jgi:hypothetical protein